MRLAVTGSSGMVGTALIEQLRSDGHTVSRIVRAAHPHSTAERLIAWNPERGSVDTAALEGHDAVVHLAGEPLTGVWTTAKKTRIRESRVRGTTLIARAVAGLERPPKVLISASGINYYGNRPSNQEIDESVGVGTGFLASVAEAWEEAAQPARSAGVRVVHTRFGPIFSPKGGALAVMLPIFRAGLGATLGNGRQVWSWVALPDVVGAILHVLGHPDLAGPVNVTAPYPVTNKALTELLGRVLHRPTIFTVPRFALRLVLRDMADDMLLIDARVVPRKLQQSGYSFKHPQLEAALRWMLAHR